MADKRTLKVAGLYGAGALGALALVFIVAGVTKGHDPTAMTIATLVAAAWGLAFAGMAWKRTDETAREAHKAAAFWGFPFGLLVLLAGLPVVARTVFHAQFQPGFAHLVDGSSPWGLVIAGVVLAALAQVLGYGVVWAGWWMQRR